MIQSTDLFHLSFYKKSPYTGSIKGMRYYIEKTTENDTDVFCVHIFPGPLCFEKTADELKQSRTFAFSEESMVLIADCINEQYAQREDYWNKHMSLLSEP